MTVAVDDVESLLGRVYRISDHYEVGREKIREFSRAVQATHSAHYDEVAANALGHNALIAPTTFTAILGGIAQRSVFSEFLPNYDLSQVLHTEQHITAYRPVRSGDILDSRIALESFRSSHGQETFVFKTDITDSSGAVVQASLTTAIARAGGVIDEHIADAAQQVLMAESANRSSTVGLIADADYVAAEPQRTPSQPRIEFSDIAVGDQLPTSTAYLRRGDLVNYAGVAGDPNPIHWNENIVSLVGLDDVVAHGMLTMGLGAEYLTTWLGDPGALCDYGVRFTRPVYVGNDAPAAVDFVGKVKTVDPATRTATIALTATANGSKIFGRSTATVQLR
ncbi:fused (3R)-hydroxyacyl-ACP dehydratase subunits HadA/HadB [Antrihabitans cavernicola]|uniref:(R)-hydratase n=1 Tax=Antrihabitans cavernicola TaxID=2495913 RepID=A0A5A7SIS5_9NOCA|nr:fused (3R)-hydroxyacyl-ACP dehydratase subunits HadA/HadB [Spelaeibacter cavernicola]KAA0024627.1 (R)-hydratase [Spelaeibacter cavernicola]